MAERGKPLPASEIRRVRDVARAVSIKGAARAVGVSRNTVRKYVRPQKPLVN